MQALFVDEYQYITMPNGMSRIDFRTQDIVGPNGTVLRQGQHQVTIYLHAELATFLSEAMHEGAAEARKASSIIRPAN